MRVTGWRVIRPRMLAQIALESLLATLKIPAGHGSHATDIEPDRHPLGVQLESRFELPIRGGEVLVDHQLEGAGPVLVQRRVRPPPDLFPPTLSAPHRVFLG